MESVTTSVVLGLQSPHPLLSTSLIATVPSQITHDFTDTYVVLKKEKDGKYYIWKEMDKGSTYVNHIKAT